MQGDDPPFLPVGTDVSAKYKGAFCEAKIKKVVRNIKCKITLKAGGGTITVNDDVIKGTLRVGNTIEVKQDPKKDAVEAVIAKIQDCSQYTVVFDDGDITTLRRSALCLKSGRHFNESETLDQLPLTHPEHFSTPVIAGRRGRRGRAQSDESEGEVPSRRVKADSTEREPHVGRVVLVEAASGTERRRPHQPAFPALVVVPTAQIKVKEDYLVRSFKDGRYYTVPKKEAREFRKGVAPLEWGGVEAALQYLNNDVLPPHWDRDSLFNESGNTTDESSDDEPREEKDHFVAQLYKFMDDRGTPLNRNPTIANKDIDLYRLFRVVEKLGGYNRVTNQNQWKTIADKMGFHPVTTTITNLCKQAYKKFLHSFEDFYRKLGVTLVAHPRGARTPPAGRSLIRDRDKLPPAVSSPSNPPAPTPPPTPVSTSISTSVSTCSTPTSTGGVSSVSTRKDNSDKSETDKSEKEDKAEKAEKQKVEKTQTTSDGEDDSTDNQPLVTATPKPEKDKASVSSSTTSEDKVTVNRRSQSKSRSVPPAKVDSAEKRMPKRRLVTGDTVVAARASRRLHVSTDSDSSGRASRCGTTKKTPSRRSQSANSASSGNTIASSSSKRQRKRKVTEPSASQPVRSGGSGIKAEVGDKLKVYYGPTQPESKVTYEAKVIEISPEGMLRVHYTGWNTRYDEWIKEDRIALNLTQHESRGKKNTNTNRRIRTKQAEESSARSDSDSSDSDEDIQRPSTKPEDKSTTSAPSRLKDNKSTDSSTSTKSRKRPIRSTSTSLSTPPKRPRSAGTGHQGRDYDLNEIRSELKGLHTVKQEPEENVKQEVIENEPIETATQMTVISPPEPPTQPEKQPEDIYEFKEPEPFEFELHDEKKKRTHRIFDDISPSKYTLTLSKSLSEEISEDALRSRTSRTSSSPSLSPFRDFVLTRDTPGGQSVEEDSKDGLFSLDDDSLPGDSSSGPTFEGFTPAKNQETYSKKSKVSKLRELIDDSPDSPADDERSTEDECDTTAIKIEPKDLITMEHVPEEEPKISIENVEIVKECNLVTEDKVCIEVKCEEMVEPEEQIKSPETPTLEVPTSQTKERSPTPVPDNNIMISSEAENKEDTSTESPLKLTPNNLPSTPEVQETEDKTTPEKKVCSGINPPKLELPTSPLIDTEEEKSEPDSPARLDVLPEPPPGFLLQSKGPKIAENLLKAINDAKRLSTSPPTVEDRPKTPLIDTFKPIKLENVPTPLEINVNIENLVNTCKSEPKASTEPELIFGETSKITDVKSDGDAKKIKSRDSTPVSSRLQSPLNVLERRKSVADLGLVVGGKNNKVLSDTIQKLSSQINQSPANIQLPPFPPVDRSESSDSDDSDRRLIIDKISMEEWGSCGSSEASRSAAPVPSLSVAGIVGIAAGIRGGLHAGKSPGEWSAGESLLMLEDACKNERKHSASVVVAGSGRGITTGVGVNVAGVSSVVASERERTSVSASLLAGEEDSNISLLFCEETIPGSPAPDAEPAPPRQRMQMPFASAPPHHMHNKDERHGESTPCDVAGGVVPGGQGSEGTGERPGWVRRRRTLLDNTPSTTPDSSDDMSPRRERRASERGSPGERKADDDDSGLHDSPMLDTDKPHAGRRSRKVSECSTTCQNTMGGAANGAGGSSVRGRRRRRDTDEAHHAVPPKYDFSVELDSTWDSQTKINELLSRISDLRKAYHAEKAELAAIDRRRKKLRRKEREAVKAAKAACL